MPEVEAENHFTVSEVAELWHLSRATVRGLFAHVPGVLRIVRPWTRNKRRFESIRIPARVVRAVHQQLTATLLASVILAIVGKGKGRFFVLGAAVAAVLADFAVITLDMD